MKEAQIIEQTIIFVKQTLQNAEGGHDWLHIERVYKNAMLIANDESVNIMVVQLGALLHDIADSKFYNGDETVGPKMASEFLKSLKIDSNLIENVAQIISNISFKNSLGRPGKKFSSKELDVIQDADRLDAMGAIGIARAFNYGGFKNRKLHDPEIPPKLNMTKEEYKKSDSPTINHFYEKLLLLKDRMNTDAGRKLAEKRHQYMVDYLEQFFNELNGLQES